MIISNVVFSYEILSVDNNAKNMEVLYESEGKKSVHVGVRIPYVDENLEDVIISFCPISYWESQEKEVQTIEVGIKNTIDLGARFPITNTNESENNSVQPDPYLREQVTYILRELGMAP